MREAASERLLGKAGSRLGTASRAASVVRLGAFRGRAAAPAAPHARFARGYSDDARRGADAGRVTVAGDAERVARAAVTAKVTVAGDSDLRAGPEKRRLNHYFLDTSGRHVTTLAAASLEMARSRRRAARRARSVERTLHKVIRGAITSLGPDAGDENRRCMNHRCNTRLSPIRSSFRRLRRCASRGGGSSRV